LGEPISVDRETEKKDLASQNADRTEKKGEPFSAEEKALRGTG